MYFIMGQNQKCDVESAAWKVILLRSAVSSVLQANHTRYSCQNGSTSQTRRYSEWSMVITYATPLLPNPDSHNIYTAIQAVPVHTIKTRLVLEVQIHSF